MITLAFITIGIYVLFIYGLRPRPKCRVTIKLAPTEVPTQITWEPPSDMPLNQILKHVPTAGSEMGGRVVMEGVVEAI